MSAQTGGYEMAKRLIGRVDALCVWQRAVTRTCAVACRGWWIVREYRPTEAGRSRQWELARWWRIREAQCRHALAEYVGCMDSVYSLTVILPSDVGLPRLIARQTLGDVIAQATEGWYSSRRIPVGREYMVALARATETVEESNE